MKKTLGLVLSFACLAFGQAHDHAAARPAALMPGMGDYHRPIATKSAEAQKYFDQGLTLMYGFNHDEAIRSFQKAADLDPAAAMPWWGIALAYGSNYNMPAMEDREKAAFAALQEALKRAPRAPAPERDYVQAVAKRYSGSTNPDYQKQAVAYKDAMKALAHKYPDDLDAATLYAESMMNLRPWKLYNKDGSPAEGTDEIVATLESVLRRNPDHPGANHYYIHAVEASAHPERALPSAARLGKMVPAAGHLVHMPAHIYIRTGDYPAAAQSNVEAAAADRAYIQATGVQGVYPMMYYSHNLHFLLEASNMEGRWESARQAADQLSGNVLPSIGMMPMLEEFLPATYLVNLRFYRYDQMLKTPEPPANAKATRAIWHFARGVSYAATGERAKAEQERKAFQDAQKEVPVGSPWGQNSLDQVFRLATAQLDARIAAARGDSAGAIAAWTRAVEEQDNLFYDEPPAWYYPVRESLGAALYKAGKYAEAEKVFRTSLEKHPRNGRALFGLWQSLKAQKQDDAAALVEREFQAAWKQADTKLNMSEL